MIKSLFVAGGLALAALTAAPVAQADTDVQVYFGVPFYSYRVGPGWTYYDGYGWYNRGRYGDIGPRFGDYRRGQRLSCDRARKLVRNSGYYNVRVRECDGRTYTFTGKRKGKTYVLYLNSRNGNIWRG